MTQNKRIAVNVLASYGRSMYALIIGLFCGRWTFMALGHVDYGLMGVVGGLVGFVSFFNDLMASAVGRFYAFSVGESQRTGFNAEGLENCRKWFNTALLIHTIIPIILIIFGYPIGVWAIEHYLVIPTDRVDACIWVWRFSCIACFMAMVNVPFKAMYTAKQEIAELTIYSFATTTLNAIFLYYMITHPGFWLVKLSAWTCFLGVVPQVLICIFAFVHFKECRIRFSYFWSLSRIKDLSVYAGGRFICALAQMFSEQGRTVAVNKILGPVKNAAMSVGVTVVSHSSMLTGAFVGSIYPAITNAAGRGDYVAMRLLANRMCKLSTFSIMLFAVPLIPEVDTVLQLWLKNPPVDAAMLCGLILGANIIVRLTDGHWMAIFAMGRVTLFNLCESVGFFLGFAASIVMMKMGLGLNSVAYGLIIAYIYTTIIKQYFGRKYCGLSVRYWTIRVMIPLIVTAFISVLIGYLPRLFLRATFLRIVITTILSESVMLILTWIWVFEKEERNFVVDQCRARLGVLRMPKKGR